MNLKDFSGNVAVIGDVMLDENNFFLTDGMSQEAPVPKLYEIKDGIEFKPGGAANVAANLRDLGIKTSLIGLTGDDKESELLRENLQDIETIFLKDEERPTILKKRIFASSKSHQPFQVLRIDREETRPLDEQNYIPLLETLPKKIEGSDVVVISDYNKGFMTPFFINMLGGYLSSRKIPVIVDTKPENVLNYAQREFNWIKPNVKETEGITGIEYTSPQDTKTLERIGNSLFSKLNLEFVLFTLGKDGMILYKSPQEFTYFPTIESESSVNDVVGAGDTVIAATAASLASGYSPEDSARIANYAASVVVGKRGTSTCSLEELTKILENE